MIKLKHTKTIHVTRTHAHTRHTPGRRGFASEHVSSPGPKPPPRMLVGPLGAYLQDTCCFVIVIIVVVVVFVVVIRSILGVYIFVGGRLLTRVRRQPTREIPPAQGHVRSLRTPHLNACYKVRGLRVCVYGLVPFSSFAGPRSLMWPTARSLLRSK